MKSFTFVLAIFAGAAMAAPTESTGVALSPRDPAMNAVAVMKSETKFADQVSQLINQHGAHKRDLEERESAEKAELASQAQQAMQAMQALASNKALAAAGGGLLSGLLQGLLPVVQQVINLVKGLGLKRDESALAERAGGDLVSTLLGVVTNLLNGLLGGLTGGGSASTGTGSGTGSSFPDLDSVLGSLTGAGSGSGSGSDPSSSFPDIASTISSILGGASKRDASPAGLFITVSKLISALSNDMPELKPAAAKFAEATKLAQQVAEAHAAQKKQ